MKTMTSVGLSAILAAGVLALALTPPAHAQDANDLVPLGGLLAKPDRVIPGVGQVYIPESSIARPEDRGLRMHTHHVILVPDVPVASPPQPGQASAPGAKSVPAFAIRAETPASLACVYRMVPQTFNCAPTKVSAVATGGSRAIGIVDAFHNPTAAADLKTFSKQFGLPVPNLKVVFCNAATCEGVKTAPRANKGWSLEIALDVQWAHAMAPSAQIILVEANSNSNADLQRAVEEAAKLVALAGGGEVSNSYGGGESKSEKKSESQWTHAGVVFFASTGDDPGTEYPSTSPNVVAVGGTTINRSAAGAFLSESAWADTGGGLSSVFPRPSFQNGVVAAVGAKRGVPDLSADADPNSGVYVYCSKSCGGGGPWFIVGGTSLSSPLMAGITNNAGHFRTSSAAENTSTYAGLGSAHFNDIISGKCRNGPGLARVNAVIGWDVCTGVGTPKGKTGL